MVEEKEKKINKEVEVKKVVASSATHRGGGYKNSDSMMKKNKIAVTENTNDKKTKSVRTFKKNTHFRRKRPTRSRSEFDQKIIKIRRVTRVVKGGRRFSFSVAIVIGDKKGSVGVGVAKGADVALAIEKSVKKAKKNLIKLNLTNNNSITYDVEKKYCSSIVKIFPTKEGRGLSAGSSVKNVLELAGITDVTAKIITRSRNKLNNAMATLEALKEFKM